MTDRLRVALVSGPMYDHLLPALDDVEVVVRADHPTLNREVAARLAKGERIDVLSTHAKYAPSQRRWLTPLDELVDVTALAPDAVAMCRFDGALLSAPRCIDVRVLWATTDDAPASWEELVEGPLVFGFPGRESGLFGTFFELVVSRGGRLFDGVTPAIDSDEARWAVETLCRLAARAPGDLPDWHYDQVDAALLDGRVDAAGAWPGGFGAIRRAGDTGRWLVPHPYPGGVSYAGVHSWAIPTTCGDIDGARGLLARLTSFEVGALDATGGNVPAHAAAFASVEPVDEVDERRLALTRATIAGGMLTYPSLERFPFVEDAGWQAINEALRGIRRPDEVPALVQRAAEGALSS
ncbi:MAG: extracellular solute-binding protein [Actinomycetota bacterium]|nr:extracellular solute-binding protein [Actinomycetota bacterium]